MVNEIKEKEILALKVLKEKYATKWFRYFIVGEVNLHNPDENMCYAVLTADSVEEIYDYPYPDKVKHSGGVTSGYNAPFTPEVGGVYIHA
jgi:hypothetical protein